MLNLKVLTGILGNISTQIKIFLEGLSGSLLPRTNVSYRGHRPKILWITIRVPKKYTPRCTRSGGVATLDLRPRSLTRSTRIPGNYVLGFPVDVRRVRGSFRGRRPPRLPGHLRWILEVPVSSVGVEGACFRGYRFHGDSPPYHADSARHSVVLPPGQTV